MALSERHGATFKPAVKDFRNSLEHTSTFFGRNLNVVNILSMDISQLSTAREAFKLLYRANADNFLAVIRNPDRNWVSPESVS